MPHNPPNGLLLDTTGLPPMPTPVALRIQREAAHFDEHYAQEAATGIPPLAASDLARYAQPSGRTIFPREFYYHLLQPLAGKHILEIACGNGIDASLAASFGAHVYAYDVSSQSIAMTRRRAEINGVSDRVHLQVTDSLENAFAGRTFDAVIGYAALHHLPLQNLGKIIRARLHPDRPVIGAVFAEPVVNNRTLDRLRRCIPWRKEEPTPDERPLNDRDIAELASHFDSLNRREFQCLSRIWPLLPEPIRWKASDLLHQADAKLMRIAALRSLASVVVFRLGIDR